MSESGQRGIPVEVSYARVFYKHLLQTVAWSLAACGSVGGIAVTLTYSADPDVDPAFALVSFFSWGLIAAALVPMFRKLPF